MTALDRLLALLDLEPLEQNLFRGQSQSPFGAKRVFGGQVLAQALIAAGRTVEEERRCHSLHAYFILPGDASAPIVYQVETLRDGGSFTTRRVTAIQHGRPIFNAALSFHREEEGLDHAVPMPPAPEPESVTSEDELARRIADRIPERLREALTGERAIDYRPVDPIDPFDPAPTEARLKVWVKSNGGLAEDPLIHQAVLAYASDYGLLGTALRPHARSFMDPQIMAASLDHAMWFHRPFRADAPLLFAMDSPSAAGARAFARGTVHNREGRLVASVAQEGLVRLVARSEP